VGPGDVAFHKHVRPAPWLAAVGTLTAVVTSLYLARRSDRQHLEVRVGLAKTPILPGVSDATEFYLAPGEAPTDLLVVTITNVGRRTATLSVIYWRPVPWRRRGFIWTPPPSHSRFPITLADGESVSYRWAVKGLVDNLSEMFGDEFADITGAIRLWLLRLCVGTSTGNVFRQRPEKELRQLFRKLREREVPLNQPQVQINGETQGASLSSKVSRNGLQDVLLPERRTDHAFESEWTEHMDRHEMRGCATLFFYHTVNFGA
jgi:hypothetical protein